MISTEDRLELNNIRDILLKYKEYLGEYGPIQRDPNCNEFVGWGHQLVKHMGETLYWQMYGEVSKVGGGRVTRLNSGMHAPYGIVLKELTRDEAIAKYGPITDEAFGPQGGFKSVTFGSTKFTSKMFRPGWELLK